MKVVIKKYLDPPGYSVVEAGKSEGYWAQDAWHVVTELEVSFGIRMAEDECEEVYKKVKYLLSGETVIIETEKGRIIRLKSPE